MRNKNLALVLILVGFIGVSTIYNVAVPIWEGLDEFAHFTHLLYVTRERKLPTKPLPDLVISTEFHQPPLYYAIAALATAWIDISDFVFVDADDFGHWHTNKRFTWWGDPWAMPLFIHTEAESFPYHGAALMTHLARFVSTIMGAVTVLCTYLLARELLRDRRTALFAASLTAFLPAFGLSSGSINNDNAVIMFSSLAILITVKMLRGPRRAWHPFALGLTLGLAALSKRTGLFLLPWVGVALLILAYKERSLRRLCSRAAITYGCWAIVSGWWYFAANKLLQAAQGGYPLPSSIAAALGESQPLLPELFGRTLMLTYWGCIHIWGYMHIQFDEWVYLVLSTFGLCGLVGVALFLLRIRRQRGLLFIWALLGLAVVLLGTSIVLRCSSSQWAAPAHGRFLFPALTAISLMLAVGVAQITPRRWHTPVFATASLGLAALAVAFPIAYIAPAYPELLPVRASIDESAIERYAPATFANGLELLGANVQPDRVRPGDDLHVAFYWRVWERPSANSITFMQLLNQSQEAAGADDRIPLEEEYPMAEWRPHRVVRDERTISIAPQARPGGYRLIVGQYHFPSLERVPILSDGPGNAVDLGWVTVLGGHEPSPQHELSALLEGGIELTGYDLALSGEPMAGDSITVTLYWQAHETVANDYTAFVHLMDDQGRVAVQDDNEPDHGNYPTSLWMQGDAVVDRHTLFVEDNLPAGEYRLVAGMYDLDTMKRLAVLSDGTDATDSAIELEPLMLERR